MYSGYLFHTSGASSEKKIFPKKFFDLFEVTQEGFTVRNVALHLLMYLFTL